MCTDIDSSAVRDQRLSSRQTPPCSTRHAARHGPRYGTRQRGRGSLINAKWDQRDRAHEVLLRRVARVMLSSPRREMLIPPPLVSPLAVPQVEKLCVVRLGVLLAAHLRMYPTRGGPYSYGYPYGRRHPPLIMVLCGLARTGSYFPSRPISASASKPFVYLCVN